MKTPPPSTSACLALTMACALGLAYHAAAASTAEAAAPNPLDVAYANTVMVDEFMTVLTAGQAGAPMMDEAAIAMIAADLVQGEGRKAAERARDFLVNKGVELAAGATAAALLTALTLGESLGMAAHEFFGSGRLQALYDNLARDTNAAGWPRSHAEAMKNDFFGSRFDAGVRPVALWLKANGDGQMSDRYYESMAYQSLIAMRDFDMGCDRYGLEGADRTPEKLQQAMMDEIGLAAARARGVQRAELFLAEMARKRIEADEAARLAALAEAERIAADAEADADAANAAAQAAQDAAEAEEEARKAAQEAEAAYEAERAALAELDADAAQPGLDIPAAETVAVELLRSERLGPDMTAFHLQITNVAGTTLRGLVPAVRPERAAPNAGVAWSAGGGPAMLPPGAALPLSFVATGDIGAALFYLTVQGEIAVTRRFDVAHEPTPDDPETTDHDGTWIELPATFKGESYETYWGDAFEQYLTHTNGPYHFSIHVAPDGTATSHKPAYTRTVVARGKDHLYLLEQTIPENNHTTQWPAQDGRVTLEAYRDHYLKQLADSTSGRVAATADINDGVLEIKITGGVPESGMEIAIRMWLENESVE